MRNQTKFVLFFEIAGAIALMVAMKLVISGIFAAMEANLAGLLGCVRPQSPLPFREEGIIFAAGTNFEISATGRVVPVA